MKSPMPPIWTQALRWLVWPTAEPDLFVRDDVCAMIHSSCWRCGTTPIAAPSRFTKGHVDVRPAGRFHVNDSLVLLGTVDGVPWFAVRTRTDNTQELRAVADDLDAVELCRAHSGGPGQLASGAHSLPALRIDDRGCPGGWVRRCLADGSEHFPRTDPAVIVLVVDDQQRALLGRRSIWPEGWYSHWPGFVEPGETFEQAVVREVLEEADVQVPVDRVEYRATQPWPFPVRS